MLFHLSIILGNAVCGAIVFSLVVIFSSEDEGGEAESNTISYVAHPPGVIVKSKKLEDEEHYTVAVDVVNNSSYDLLNYVISNNIYAGDALMVTCEATVNEGLKSGERSLGTVPCGWPNQPVPSSGLPDNISHKVFISRSEVLTDQLPDNIEGFIISEGEDNKIKATLDPGKVSFTITSKPTE